MENIRYQHIVVIGVSKTCHYARRLSNANSKAQIDSSSGREGTEIKKENKVPSTSDE
jgi:hypothetical protein